LPDILEGKGMDNVGIIHIIAIWNILQLYLVYYMAIWLSFGIFSRFGTLYQEKSGNPAVYVWSFVPEHLDVCLDGPADDVDELGGRDDAPVQVDPERRRRVDERRSRRRGRDAEGRVQVPDTGVDGDAIVHAA
jgi:hypothetical protein